MTTVSPNCAGLRFFQLFSLRSNFKSDLIPSTQFINDYLDDEEKDLILQIFIDRSFSPLLIFPALLPRPHSSSAFYYSAPRKSPKSTIWWMANCQYLKDGYEG
jgi:hypothetical protein